MEAVGLILLVALCAVLVGLLISYAAKKKEQWRRALYAVSEEFGLTYSNGTLFKAAKSTGSTAGFPLTVDSYTVSTGKSSQTFTRIVLTGAGKLPRLLLEKEGIGSSIKKAFVGEDIQIGDDRFDETIVLRGSEDDAVIYLDEQTRDRAIAAIAAGAKLKDGNIKLVRSGLVYEADKLVRMVSKVVDLASSLHSGNTSIQQRLMATATQDSSTSVRKAALKLLLRSYPDTPEAKKAAHSGLDSRDPAIRLTAARALHEWEVITKALLNTHVPMATRLSAAELIGSKSNSPNVAAALEEQLSRHDSDETLQTEVLAAMFRMVYEPTTAQLAPYAAAKKAELREQVALHLRRLPGAKAEPLLISMLENEEEDSVLVRIAEALAQTGSIAAVEPLLKHTKGILNAGRVKDACRTAVKSIQERAGEVDGGRLSVVAAEGGGLAVASEEGALGIASDAGHVDESVAAEQVAEAEEEPVSSI